MIFKIILSINILLLSANLFKLAHANHFDPKAQFINNATLVKPDRYLLFWNYTDEDIIFKIVVQNDGGWVGFGISPDGSMPNSDLIIAWANQDGTGHFSNRYTVSNSIPILSSNVHWFLEYMLQENGYLTVVFTRKITICNKIPGDVNIDIVLGTQHVIYSWGSKFFNGDIQYHGQNRSSISLPLISSLNQNIVINMNETETLDFRVNTSLYDGSTTEYFCQMFQLPNDYMKTKRHLIQYETLIRPASEINHVHHWLIYECDPKYETEYLKSHTAPDPGPCFSLDQYQPPTSWPNVMNYCQKITLGWAVGGSLVTQFPEDIAYPLGATSGSSQYFILQIHYDNTALDQNVQDESGIRFFVTQNYRKTEFGVLTVGADSSWASITIPPNAPSFNLDFYCRKGCTNRLYQESSNITIFAHLPHTHIAGRSLYSKIIRNGTEVAYIGNNKYYDFNFQYVNYLSKPVVLEKDDEIKVSCVYNTFNYDTFTVGGPATRNEMCLDFLWYYPRNPSMDECLSLTSYSEWQSFLITLNRTGQIALGPNLNSNNVEIFLSISKGFKNSVSLFQNFFQNSNKTEVCVINDKWQISSYPAYQVNPIIESNLNCINPPPPPPPNNNSQPTSYYVNHEELVPGVYHFYWNTTDTDLIAEIHCLTNGWVGFGFSPDGEMEESDIVVGWIDSSGNTNFTDRFATKNSLPLIDSNQNYILLYSGLVNGYTIFKFRRPLILCDLDDLPIQIGTPHVIYAWGTQTIRSGRDINYHQGNRGSKQLMIINNAVPVAQLQADLNLLPVDFTISNIVLPPISTFYYCQSFQVPTNFDKKRYVVQWEIIMPTNKNNIHRVVVYECDSMYNGTPKIANSCYGGTEPGVIAKLNYCQIPMLVWVVGGAMNNTFGPDMGIPIGGDSDYKYLVVEVHYNNPELNIVGNIGSLTVRFFVTEKTLKHELGMLQLGASFDMNAMSIAIPPQMKSFTVKTYCSHNFLGPIIGQNSITAVSFFPHTHLTGINVETKIIRNGTDIGYLGYNKYYHSNYQNAYLLNPYIDLTINDDLITTCNYSTMNRTKFTYAGFSTQDEMCFNYVMYYPRNKNIIPCLSSPSVDDYYTLMTQLNSTFEVELLQPADLSLYSKYVAIMTSMYNLSFMTEISDTTKIGFQNLFENANFTNLSALFGISQPPIKPSNVYVEPNICSSSIKISYSKWIICLEIIIMRIIFV